MNPVAISLLGMLAGIITTGSGAYVATRKLRADIRKVDADASVHEASAAVKLIDAARELIEPYQEQVTILRQELAAARRDVSNFHQLNREVTARVRQLEHHVQRLEEELFAAGIAPPEPPPEENPS